MSKIKVKCPKCGNLSMIGAGYALRKGGKVHSSKCTNCGYTCVDTKLNIPYVKFIEPKKEKEQPKKKNLIDKGHIL